MSWATSAWKRFIRLVYSYMRFSQKHRFNVKFGLIIGIIFILLSVIGLESWSPRKELIILFHGLSFIAIAVLFFAIPQVLSAKRFEKQYDVIASYKPKVFDIDEDFINEMTRALEDIVPGITRYGIYDSSPQNDESKRYAHGDISGWKNRKGKRLGSICWKWEQESTSFVLGYERGLGIRKDRFVRRFIGTAGLSYDMNKKLTAIISNYEAHGESFKPDLQSIRKIGLNQMLVVSAIIVSLLLNDGGSIGVLIESLETHQGWMTLVRMNFIHVSLAFLMAHCMLWIRGKLLPAGVFRIDEEKNEQEIRDILVSRIASRVKKCMLILALLGMVWMASSFVADRCLEKNDETSGVLHQFQNSNLCGLVQDYGPTVNKWSLSIKLGPFTIGIEQPVSPP